MESTVHHTIVGLKVWQPDLRQLPPPPPPSCSSPNSPPKRLLFEYVFQTRTCKFIRPSNYQAAVNGRPYMLGNLQILSRNQEIVDSDTILSSPEETRQIILANLCELLRYGPRIDHESIVKGVVNFSRIACHNVFNAGKDTIWVQVKVEEILVTIFHERDLIQRFADSTAAETSYGMVPARKKSVRDLKSKKLTSEVTGDSTSTCVVCLEELRLDTEVTYMPCSHMFHQQCIATWLETGHHCPVCRFEMPTEDDDEDEDDGQLKLLDRWFSM